MNKHNKGGYLIFLLSPMVALIYAMRNLENRHSRNIIWAICAYMGYSIQITQNYQGDAVRYIKEFEGYGLEQGKISSAVSNLFINTANIEIVERVLSMFVATITNNYHILLMVYGLFFGYFFSRNISYLYSFTQASSKKGMLWIIVALFFTLPPWGINGFNFWTASQIFIFAMLPYIIANDKRRLWFLILAPLTHFSFYVIIIISISFYFFRKRNFKWFYVLSTLFLFVNFSSQSIGNLLVNFVPDVFMHKFTYYTQGAAQANKKTGGRIFEFFNRFYLIGMTVFFFCVYHFNQNFIKTKFRLNLLFQYGFYLMSTICLLSMIPSMARYLAIGNWILFSAVAYLLFISESQSRLNYLKRIIGNIRPLILLLASITIVRHLFPILGLGAFFSNPLFVSLFIDDDFVIGNIVEMLYL